MELRELLAVLGKYRRIIAASAIVLGVAALLISLQIPPEYKAIFTLYVKRSAQPASEEFYAYDGYYSQQAAERYTDTVVGLLESRGLLKTTLESLGLLVDQKSLKKARKLVEVKRVAPQLVEVNVTRRWGPRAGWEAKGVANSLAAGVVEQVRQLNEAGDPSLSLELLSEEPIIEKHEPMAVLNAAVGVLVGLLISVCLVMFWEYFGE